MNTEIKNTIHCFCSDDPVDMPCDGTGWDSYADEEAPCPCPCHDTAE